MTPRASVLVPTHDHGPLLRLAVESALAQTVADLEVLIVGDGATEETAETARSLEKADGRVRFFAFPKGEHHGERHRHSVLAESSAPIVCYLGDDDLWFPDHVAHIEALLSDADFAHGLGVRVSPDDSLHVYPGDLGDERWRHFVLERGNFIPLHAAGHTAAMYRRLPHGWRVPPEGVWSDVHMWRQFLAMPDCRAVTGRRVTSLHITSDGRRDAGTAERLREMEGWAALVADASGRAVITERVVEALSRQLAEAVAASRDAGPAAKDFLQRLERDLAAAEQRRAEASRRADHMAAKVASMRGSMTWRARERALGVPGMRALIRRVGRARSRGAGR